MTEPGIFEVKEPVKAQECLAPRKIGPGETCEFEVTFKPTKAKSMYSGKYVLQEKAVGGPWVVVNFTGGTK